MATAQTIIDRAYRLLGAVASGDSATSDESADALIALNAMLESWQLEKLMVYAVQDKTYTLEGSGAITLGAAGNITTRPDKIEAAFIRSGNNDYPLIERDLAWWVNVTDKTVTTDIPSDFYYEPSYPQGVLNLYPVPTVANVLHVMMWVPFTAFAAVGTSVSLPPGYERALAYNLAIDIAPELEREPSRTVVTIAKESKAAIKRGNSKSISAMPEIGSMGHGRFDIFTDA